MNIFVQEIGTTATSTASLLSIDDKPFCFVIEDGYHEVKVPGKTRIPPGCYQVTRKTSGRFFEKYRKEYMHEFSIQLENVPGFKDILIHIGNTIEDTRGCLLVNTGLNINLSGTYFGTGSVAAYKPLYSLIFAAFRRGEEVYIEISRREAKKG